MEPEFKTRAYNKVTYDKDNNQIIKESNTERFEDEKSYYTKIPPQLKDLFPSFKIENNKLYLDYIPSTPVVIGVTPLSEWESFFRCVLNTMNTLHSTTESYGRTLSQEHLRSMYIDKTTKEYHAFRDVDTVGFCKSDTLVINGHSFANYHVIEPLVLKLCDKLLLGKYPRTVVHGDYCFGNMLWDGNKITLIDPRGSWGEKGIFGDPRYDLAKIYHSLEGRYEDIVNDRFEVESNATSIYYQFQHKDNQPVLDIFEKLLNNPDRILTARLIQGLIFIGMCARHYDSCKRQAVMYATGVKILNEVLDEYCRINGRDWTKI